MFIYHFKMNGTNIFRAIIIGVIMIALIVLFVSIYQFYYKTKFVVHDGLPTNSIANISSNQYTSILKEVYADIDTYIGQTINFTGYVYRLYDLKDSEFILARDMLMNSDSQSVVVGFLCTYENAKDFKEGTWVNVTGTIIKGYYHNEIPVIDITKMEEANRPEEAYVYPPDDSYIPTAVIL